MGDLREPEREHVYTMDEVREHTSENDAWIVVDDVIYDITNFWKKHPGGQNVIMAFAGMDASVRNFPVNTYIAYTFLRHFHTFREKRLVTYGVITLQIPGDVSLIPLAERPAKQVSTVLREGPSEARFNQRAKEND